MTHKGARRLPPCQSTSPPHDLLRVGSPFRYMTRIGLYHTGGVEISASRLTSATSRALERELSNPWARNANAMRYSAGHVAQPSVAYQREEPAWPLTASNERS